ncbi:hypothetical protein E2C01_033391 [Portunus trituberculatus]|uniref:Uncharacterized protein n=1 Tax=Portunus trituberculatus TaxID=210409 RepID=A0A5B7F012_PORTR|nr:hypothetical protein [Portunus trituberculatus]
MVQKKQSQRATMWAHNVYTKIGYPLRTATRLSRGLRIHRRPCLSPGSVYRVRSFGTYHRTVSHARRLAVGHRSRGVLNASDCFISSWPGRGVFMQKPPRTLECTVLLLDKPS